MNKAYRLIWSRVKEAWIVVSEKVAAKGGPRAATVTLSAALLLAAGSASALPTGSQIVSGTAGITTSGSTMTITNSAGAIINWQAFSIANGETTRFIQPSAVSAVLNRVTGGDPSKILGTLQSNGKVLLINPSGIIFGPGSRVDVNGLIASSLDIANQDFLAGRMKFAAGPMAGKVENQGVITTPSGGSVYLIAPDVQNSGVITAPNGDVLLAAGKEVLLVESANPEIAMVVTAPDGHSINLGTIVAAAGRIGMYGSVVRQKGRISADSAVSEGGKIFLRATKSIELADTSVTSADGTKGGQIIAKTEENGEISGTLTARGMLSAQGDGSSGSGGFIETSAAKLDLNGVKVNTNGGMWLLDPVDFTIAASGGDITGAALGTLLDANSVTIQTTTGTNTATNLYGTAGTNGNILVNNDINWTMPNKLSLIADGGIVFNANVHGTDPGSTLSLTAATTVSQGAYFIMVGNLALKGTANYLLDFMLNDIKTVASDTSGSVYVKNNGAALAVGSVDGVVGITTGTAVTLVSGGTLTLNEHITGNNLNLSGNGIALNKAVTATGTVTLNAGAAGLVQATSPDAALTATALEALGSGSFWLINDSNSVGTIAANITGTEAPFTFKGTGGFSIGSVGGTTGVRTNGGLIDIRNYTSGAITVGESVTTTVAGTGNVIIDVASGAGTATVATGKTVAGNDVQLYTSGGNIVVNGAVTGTTSANIHAGTGAISTGTTGLITAPTIILQNDPSLSGDIGASGTPFKTSSPGGTGNTDISIGVSAYGPSAVYLTHTGDATITAANLSANPLFSFQSSGNLTVPTINTGSSALTLKSTGGALVTTGDLSGNAIDLTAAGDFVPVGNISAATNLTIDLTGAGSKFTRAAGMTVGGTTSTTIKADKMNNSAPGSLGAAGSTVTLLPKAGGRAITLGTDNGDAGGDLELSTNDLSNVVASVLRVGDTLSGALNVGAAIAFPSVTSLRLGSGSTVSQGPAGTISIANLGVTSLGSVDLSNAANMVTGNIAAQIGDGTHLNKNFRFKNSSNLNVGTVDGVAGITTQISGVYNSGSPDGVIALTSDGDITQSAVIAGKALKAMGKSVTLTGANPVGVIAGSIVVGGLGDFRFTSTSGISVETIDGLSGVTNNNGSSTGYIGLTAGSGISQSSGTSIVAAGTLSLTANGPVSLNGTTNVVAALTANLASGSLTFADASDLNVTGITTVNNFVDLQVPSANSITVNGPINVGTGANAIIKLMGGGIVYSAASSGGEIIAFQSTNQAQGITLGSGSVLGSLTDTKSIELVTDKLTLPGTPGDAKAQVSNALINNEINIKPNTANTTIGIGSGGTLNITDTSSATFNAPTLVIGTKNGDPNPAGGIAVNAPVSRAGGRLALLSGAGITQGTGSAITVSDLAVIAGGAVGLNGTTNTVSNLAIETSTGAIDFANSGGLTITSITGGIVNPTTITGIKSIAGGNVSVSSTGGIILAAPVVTDTSASTVTLSSSSGSITDSTAGASVIAKSLNASAYSGIGTIGTPVETQVSTLNASNNMAGGVYISNSGPLNVSGMSVAGDIWLDNAAALSVSGPISGNNITLQTSGSFTNSSGAGALTASGRWLVWSANPSADTRGGLVYDFKQYNATQGVTAVAQATGNGFLYSLAPTVSTSLIGSVTRTYDGTTTATLNGSNYSVSGAIDGDTVLLNNPTVGSFDSKNVGSGKTITVSGITATSASNGAAVVYGYSASGSASGAIGDITAKALTVTATGANKVYDGNTTATVVLADNRIAGDILTLSSSASFSDKNVASGKTVTVSGINVSGADAGNYSSNSSAATTADITVRPLSTWTAGVSGLWSNPGNWDALPDGQNVLAVSIPSGGSYQVNYDGGSTTLQSLNSSQTLLMTGGNLAIGTALNTTGLLQSGGSITGTGSLNVTNSFNQSGGSINLAGAANLTQATGDLNIAALTAATVSLTATSGGIGQSGSIIASCLTTHSATGTVLNSANQIGNFSAVNDSSGDITLTNSAAPLTIATVTQSGPGNVVIDNTGATITGPELISSGGSVSISAHSPLTIGSGGITAAGDILLVAAASGGADNLTINGPVASTSGGITLKAGVNVVIGANGSATAVLGSVTTTDQSGTSVVGGTPPTVNSGALLSAIDAATITTPVAPEGLLLVALAPQSNETAGNGTDKDKDGEIDKKKKKKDGREQQPAGGDKKDDTPKKKYCN